MLTLPGKYKIAHKPQLLLSTVSEDFEYPLPKPEELIPPTPGWKLTPLQDPNADSGSKAGFFPTRQPLPSTKLAAARGDDRSIHLFYQATDGSIQELTFYPGRGWSSGSNAVVLEPAVAKHGSPLTAVAGGWTELRLFYVDTADLLKEVYSDDHTKWTNSEFSPPSFHFQFSI